MAGEHSPWIAWAPGLLGVALALVSFALPLPAATRLSRRLRQLRRAPVLASLERMRELGGRIEPQTQAFEALVARSEAAIESVSASVRELRLPQAVTALRLVGASVGLLVGALRARR